MKKSLLFVIPGLSAGGGEKSLVNLLSQIDYKRYNVDLFLFNHDGIFVKYIPDEVNILPTSEIHQLLKLSVFKSVFKLLLKGNLLLFLYRLMIFFTNRLSRNISIREQQSWKYFSRIFGKLEKSYDIAIGYLEKSSTYFCVDNVVAKRKIGWVHIDYDQLGMDPKFDIRYFDKLDNIITVSDECATILKNRFPSQQHKIKIIQNIVSPKMINKMAKQCGDNLFNRKSDDEIVILSVGRLHYQKGFEIAIEVCKILVERDLNIKWYVIGEGKEKRRLETLIRENQLEHHFKLLGLRSNPYPYIKQADIYVQPSRFEGKSIAIDEAKILKKPILITNYNTAKDQIQSNYNGLVVERKPDAIAEGLVELIKDKSLRLNLVENLTKEQLGTEEEVMKLYKLLGDDNEEKNIICNE